MCYYLNVQFQGQRVNFIITTLRKINIFLLNLSVDLTMISIISVRFLFLNIIASCALEVHDWKHFGFGV